MNNWRKSSYSGGASIDCVETASGDGMILVRDTTNRDGGTLAFSADYEGSDEIYTMPATGGLPLRRTYEGGGAQPAGWTPEQPKASRNEEFTCPTSGK